MPLASFLKYQWRAGREWTASAGIVRRSARVAYRPNGQAPAYNAGGEDV